MMPTLLVVLARAFGFVRETDGPNRGLWVGIFQRFVGINPGDSWCAAFVCFVCAITYGGRSKLPFPVSGRCEDIYQWARENGHIITRADALPGDLYVYVTDADHAHHIGVVTAPAATDGIAGNTSEDGTSSNGTGVYEHGLTTDDAHIEIIRLPAAA